MVFLEKQYGVQVWASDHLIENASGIYILYVAAQHCSIQMEGKHIPLTESEVFLINFRNSACVEIPSGCLVAAISLDYPWLCRLAEQEQLMFVLEDQDPTGRWYQELKRRVEGFLLACTEDGFGQVFREREAFYSLLCLLIQHYRKEETEPSEGDRNHRLLHILALEKDLSLQELAAKIYLSPAATSRLFQKVTGERFSQYKKRVRLEQVKENLETSRKPITAIAMEAGFTSSTVFNRDFKDAFGMTPSQFRKGLQQKGEKPNCQQGLPQVQQLLEEKRRTRQQGDVPTQRIWVNQQEGAAWVKPRNRLLNVGSAHLLQEAEMQNQIAFLAQRLDVEYLRIWSLFSPQMLQGTGDTFSFSKLDAILDFCVDHKLKLDLDLAQHRDFSWASESQEIYSHDTQQSINWFVILDTFLRHIRQRYTEEVVSHWIYEFTFYLNDKPLSRREGETDVEVWKKGYTLVKSILPTARVAGPGLLSGNPEETERVIASFLDCGFPPDILTTTHYPYSYQGDLQEESIFQKKLQKVDDRDFLEGQIEFVRRLLQKHKFSGEFWVTDWGISLANRNFIQDSCYRGAAILDHVIRSQEKADVIGLFCASDLLSAYGDSSNVLSGSAGLLSQTGIRKPAYYAYRFLRFLGRYRLCQTDHCLVTGEGPGELRILCYNNKALGPKYYLLEENSHRPESLNGLIVDLDPLSIELLLTGLPVEHGPFLIRQRILNEKQGGPLAKWIHLGCISNLSRDDLEFLERTSVPEVSLEKREAPGGELLLQFTMEPNEIRYISIS